MMTPVSDIFGTSIIFYFPQMYLAIDCIYRRRAERKGNMREVRKYQKKSSNHFAYADDPPRLLKPRKKPARKCQLCGKDPSPNYFYCPSCHHRVSHYSVEMDGEQEEFGLSDF